VSQYGGAGITRWIAVSIPVPALRNTKRIDHGGVSVEPVPAVRAWTWCKRDRARLRYADVRLPRQFLPDQRAVTRYAVLPVTERGVRYRQLAVRRHGAGKWP